MWRRTRATQVGHGARGSLYLYVSHWDLGSFVSVALLQRSHSIQPGKYSVTSHYRFLVEMTAPSLLHASHCHLVLHAVCNLVGERSHVDTKTNSAQSMM